MSILMQKLFRRLHEEQSEDGGAGGGGEITEFSAAELARATELEASRKGWIPKHKYTGPEGKWKTAEQFLADGANFTKNLQGELARVKQELAEFKGTAKQFAEFQQRQIEERDSQITSLISDLRRQQRQAIRDGDDDTADAIDGRIDVLTEEQRRTKETIEKAKNPQQPSASVVNEDGTTSDPVVSAWIEDGNQWFRENARMRAYCFQYANELIAGGEKARGAAFLEKLTDHMKEAFPRHFDKEASHNTGRGSMHESGRSGGNQNSYSEADLPSEDRALMELGIKQGWTTKEKFLKNYFSEDRHVHKTTAKTKK